MPKFAVLLHASARSEAGELPSNKLLQDMMAYNETLVKAGVMVAGDGFQHTAKGARLIFGKDSTFDIQKGPFTSTPVNERISGFWVLKTDTQEDAISWLKKCPLDEGTIMEVRKILEAEDFGDVLTPEMQKKGEELRAQVAQGGGK